MIKRISNKALTYLQFEEEINSVEEGSTVYLETGLEFDLRDDRRFLVGMNNMRSLIAIHKRDIILDGQGNKIVFHCHQPRMNDIALFQICQEALGTEIRNLAVDFHYLGENTSRRVICIRNNAYGAKILHCKLAMESKSQINFTVIQNDRRIETVFDREGDNFVVEGNDIRIRCESEQINLPTSCYGIYNDLPNSMEITNNYLYLMVNGSSEKQQVTGVFNNGRFVRIVNNNIKANGFHMDGTKMNHPRVIGVYNEGEYLLFSSNNCVAEWAGNAIGLYNQGSYCTFNANKFIGTHAIRGTSVLNFGNDSSFTGNVVTSTSRNPRLVVNWGNRVCYMANILRSFFYIPDCQSGCGMIFESCTDCTASDNRISGVKNCGIFLRDSKVVLRDNYIENQNENWVFHAMATESDMDVADALSESKIHSIE